MLQRKLPVIGILLAAVVAWPTGAAEGPRNIILIGWDGCQRDHLKEMIGRNEVPNLMALAKEGALVDIDVVTGATDTKAGWSQILTGYAPEKTGVYSNSRYQPIPEGYSLFERLQKALGKETVATAAIVGKSHHVDADAPARVPYDQWLRRQKRQKRADQQAPGPGVMDPGKVVEENGRKFVLVNGKPHYHASQAMDLWVNALGENENVGKRALEALDQYKDRRFFLFIHFQDPDHSGHKHGENSDEYTNAIKSDDEWTGRIVSRLKELGLYDKTLVYVTADHGFNDGQRGHRYAPYVFLATNDKQVNRNGTREDIAPTILKRFGVDLAAIEPKLDGIPLDEPAAERKAPATPPAGIRKAGGKAGANGKRRARRQKVQ